MLRPWGGRSTRSHADAARKRELRPENERAILHGIRAEQCRSVVPTGINRENRRPPACRRRTAGAPADYSKRALHHLDGNALRGRRRCKKQDGKGQLSNAPNQLTVQLIVQLIAQLLVRMTLRMPVQMIVQMAKKRLCCAHDRCTTVGEALCAPRHGAESRMLSMLLRYGSGMVRRSVLLPLATNTSALESSSLLRCCTPCRLLMVSIGKPAGPELGVVIALLLSR